jgi:hypothetical protein
MITVTANAFHEKLHVQEEEIILNGPPSALAGNISISNRDEEALFIRGLPIFQSQQDSDTSAMPETLKLITSLRPGEERMHRVSHNLPRTTPPGTYERIIRVGGKEKRLKLIVQPSIEIDMSPLDLHFNGVVPGGSYNAQISFANKGNMPFKLPDIKHVTTLDTDYLCRATSLAMREKGGEGFTAMMDELTRNIHRDMADWAIVRLEESGRIIAPGENIQLHFTLSLPKDVDPGRDYSGTVRVWDNMLSYHIKSHEDYSSEKIN